MKQNAKTVAAVTVREYIHLVSLTNVLRLPETSGSQTHFLWPEIAVEQGWEGHL